MGDGGCRRRLGRSLLRSGIQIERRTVPQNGLHLRSGAAIGIVQDEAGADPQGRAAALDAAQEHARGG